MHFPYEFRPVEFLKLLVEEDLNDLMECEDDGLEGDFNRELTVEFDPAGEETALAWVYEELVSMVFGLLT